MSSTSGGLLTSTHGPAFLGGGPLEVSGLRRFVVVKRQAHPHRRPSRRERDANHSRVPRCELLDNAPRATLARELAGIGEPHGLARVIERDDQLVDAGSVVRQRDARADPGMSENSMAPASPIAVQAAVSTAAASISPSVGAGRLASGPGPSVVAPGGTSTKRSVPATTAATATRGRSFSGRRSAAPGSTTGCRRRMVIAPREGDPTDGKHRDGDPVQYRFARRIAVEGHHACRP